MRLEERERERDVAAVGGEKVRDRSQLSETRERLIDERVITNPA